MSGRFQTDSEQAGIRIKLPIMNNPENQPDFSPTSNAPTDEEIALRAHQLWCQQGCPHGHDVDNWLEAQRQLLSEYGNRGTTRIPANEDVPIGGRETTYSALSEDAPLATRVDAELRGSPRPASRQSPTSLDL